MEFDENPAAAKPDETSYDTLVRWFVVCRTLEQIHMERSISYDKWNSRGGWIILALAFFSGVLAAIPVRKECEDADGNIIEEENGWLLEGTKAALIECCAAFTIMATGIRQQLKYESKCEAHRVAGRSFKELLLRFENLVQCGIHYLVPGQAGGVDSQRSFGTPGLTPGPSFDRAVQERELEPRRTPSWKDWHDDFLRIMKESPFTRPGDWDKTVKKAGNGQAVNNMRQMVRKLAVGGQAPAAPAPAPSSPSPRRPSVPLEPPQQLAQQPSHLQHPPLPPLVNPPAMPPQYHNNYATGGVRRIDFPGGAPRVHPACRRTTEDEQRSARRDEREELSQ